MSHRTPHLAISERVATATWSARSASAPAERARPTAPIGERAAAESPATVTSLVEWSVAGRPVPGEERSGDQALVLATGQTAVVAIVDGVGHGDAAAGAAEAAMRALRGGDRQDVVALARRCHEALRGTRGAALGLAVLRGDRTLTWLGVGNIVGRLVPGGAPSASGGHCLASQAGVAGDALPPLGPATISLGRGDLLVLATDGVDTAFADDLSTTGSCDEIARSVLRAHGRETDDALVVAARYLGEDQR